jgi:hypothetical protein
MLYQAEVDSGEGGLDIWWVERREDHWGEPRSIGPPVNTEKLESQPSLTADGVL